MAFALQRYLVKIPRSAESEPVRAQQLLGTTELRPSWGLALLALDPLPAARSPLPDSLLLALCARHGYLHGWRWYRTAN
jgi:hypothetical protein